MNSPLVSIISPTYNHENYISDCIQSVQLQTYTNWEMIIVDDGSTDETYEIALSFAKNDNRIKVFTQKNIGIFRLGETYNFALLQSTGKYIAVLEGDDVWLPEKLELQVAEMENKPDTVLSWGQAYSSTFDLSANYNLHPNVHRDNSVFNNLPIKSASKDLLFTCFIPALTVVIRKSALDKTGGFIQNHGLPLVDLPTWQQLSLLGNFAYVEKPLGKWRIYSNQVTKTYTAEMAEGFYKLSIEFFNQNELYFKTVGIKEMEIHRYFKKLLVINYSRSGRYKLIRKNFSEARKDYCTSIIHFGFHEPIWKLRSLIGIIFSLFHADIETFTKLIGRVSYK
ncbi:MAG: glycosyltransferase [Paludibacter sp.]|nr:glycosyltransferase [Paludibacter sp.]